MKPAFGLVCLVLFFGSALGHNELDSIPGSPSSRIINGTAVPIERFPFLARVYQIRSLLCGGTIITNRHVLTSAKCFVNNFPAQYVTVMAGSSEPKGGFEFQAEAYTTHPKYFWIVDDYDVAVVTIIGTFDGYPNVAPLPLQEPKKPTWCYIAGWGRTEKSVQEFDTLHQMWTQVITQQSCAKQIPWAIITSRTICTSIPNSRPCDGDAGDPLICNGRLAGVLQFKFGCWPDHPFVHTNIWSSTIREFIRTTAGV